MKSEVHFSQCVKFFLVFLTVGMTAVGCTQKAKTPEQAADDVCLCFARGAEDLERYQATIARMEQRIQQVLAEDAVVAAAMQRGDLNRALLNGDFKRAWQGKEQAEHRAESVLNKWANKCINKADIYAKKFEHNPMRSAPFAETIGACGYYWWMELKNIF